MGGYAYLDAIGFRYYLPAGLIRSVRSGHDEGVAFHLRLPSINLRRYRLRQWALLTTRQKGCIRRFIEFMIVVTERTGDDYQAKYWRRALKGYWRDF